jgi:hypothetical protein
MDMTSIKTLSLHPKLVVLCLQNELEYCSWEMVHAALSAYGDGTDEIHGLGIAKT